MIQFSVLRAVRRAQARQSSGRHTSARCLMVSLCALALTCLSCGGSKQTGSTNPNAVSDSSEPAATALLVPLEPAGAPAGLVVKSRVTSVQKLLDGILEGASLPAALSGGARDFEQFMRGTWPRTVALDLPLEVLVFLNPDPRREPFTILSVGTRDLPGTVRELAQRGLDPREGPGGTQFFTYEGQACAVGRARGPSPARIVCASSPDALVHLLPYSLRGFPAEPTTGDVFFHVDMKPVRAAYGRQLRSLKLLASVGARQLHVGERRFDTALTDIAVALADELSSLSEDLDTIEGRLREKQGSFEGELQVHFAGESSWTVHGLGAWARTMGPAPAAFDRLPSDAISAGYGRPWPAETLVGVRRTLVDLIAGYAAHEKLSPALRAKIEKTAGDLLHLETAPTVQATGPLVVHRNKTDSVLVPAWQLWGSARPEAQLTTLLSDSAAIIATPEFKKWVEDPQWMPTLQRHAGGLKGFPKAAVFKWQLPEALRNPAQGMLKDAPPTPRELETLRDIAETSSPFEAWAEGYFAVTRLGDMTWLVFGRDLDQLAEPLRSLQNGSSPTLATQPELRELRARPAVGAAFFKVSALASLAAAYLPDGVSSAYPQMLESTPGRGRIPATYVVEASRNAGTDLRMSVYIPKAFLTDAATLIALAATDESTK